MVVLACPIVKGDFDIYSSGTLELRLYLSLEISRAPVLDGSSVAFFPFVLMDHLDGAVFLLYFRQLLLALRLLCPLLHLLCVAGFCHEHIPKLPDMVHVLIDGKIDMDKLAPLILGQPTLEYRALGEKVGNVEDLVLKCKRHGEKPVHGEGHHPQTACERHRGADG